MALVPRGLRGIAGRTSASRGFAGAVVLLLLTLHSCGGEDIFRSALLDRAACGFAPASAGYPADWSRSSSVLARPASATSFALSGEDELVMYEMSEGVVTRVRRASGDTLLSFGRLGEGPGEFAAANLALLSPAPKANWVWSWGDSIGVLDGRRIQVFDREGNVNSVRDLAQIIGARLSVGTRALAWRTEVILDRRLSARQLGDSASRSNDRVFELLSITESQVRVLARAVLPPLPRLQNGSVYEGFSEARSSWTLGGRCFVITDGSSDTFVVGRLDSEWRDTLRLPLPRHFANADSAKARAANLLGLRTRDVPNPALPARTVAIALDAHGWLWIEPASPVRSDRGVEVWRHHLLGGQFVVDTLSGLPTAFDAAGNGYAMVRDSLGNRAIGVVLRDSTSVSPSDQPRGMN